MSFQKTYGLYGLKHQIVETSGDVTDAGQQQQTKEDIVTQLRNLKLRGEYILLNDQVSQLEDTNTIIQHCQSKHLKGWLRAVCPCVG